MSYCNFLTDLKKRVGDDKIWDKAESALLKAIKQSKLKYEINKGEGAFYGPKIDFVLRDSIGRDWQCGTLQVDLNLPSRLRSFLCCQRWIKKSSCNVTPRFIWLFRKVYWNFDRALCWELATMASSFTGRCSSNYSEFDSYAKEIFEQCLKAGINTEVDLKNQKINYKIREYSLSKVPLLLICGQKEVEDKSVTIRKLGSEKTRNSFT